MMYFYSQQFKVIKKEINKKNIDSIDIKFAIPTFNLNSFRTEANLKCSILYDMGCYPFSLLAYFKFDLKNFKIRYIVKKKSLVFFEVYFSFPLSFLKFGFENFNKNWYNRKQYDA